MDRLVRAVNPAEPHGKLRLGVLTVLVIAAVLGGALGLGKLGVGRATYRADFLQAAGLTPGDQVTVAGVRVGAVRAMRLEGDHVVVTMDIDNGVRLGADTRAAIKLTTLLGARYVDVQPAGGGELDGHRIPLAHTEVPYDLQTALQDATTTFEAVDARKIAQSMTTMAEQLRGAPEILPRALGNIEDVSAVIAARRDQISDMLTSSQKVTQLLGRQQSSLGLLITRGHDVLGELAARRQLIVRMIDATTALVNQLRPILVDDRTQIDDLLANLDRMLAAVGDNDAVLRSTLQMMPVPLRNFTNATGNGNEFDFTSSGGTMIDSYMCAISGRAEQFNLPTYFEDCR
ncbi:MCE family protein [Mycolicibacterium parafortuitum]|uniref:Mce family protein [Nocardia brasiliensis ATCC] n=1 Tax=Mycolicibacterium parafortuitum TaxID=39692 RepID=A0A375YIL4_MYCPF|nr:MCE family protein [Mycolicibacterium parafortuitum]ORB32595.1 mammalian cell entry protein [Mycolicibacterium parafortuitum]SRX80956.1 Mce family protein [Nocardia brasiliensis ATCC] [Mycolicibacterium parafortuitum]